MRHLVSDPAREARPRSLGSSVSVSHNPAGGAQQSLLRLQRSAGNRAVRGLMGGEALQTKLAVGASRNRYEQEADALAARATSEMGAENATRLGRAISPLGSQTDGTAGRVDEQTSAEITRARGGGKPLADPARTKMERAFGVSFDRVRVHADGAADRLNRRVSARAFTVGNDLFFRRGQYLPDEPAGQKLIAHELTHVMQQSAAPAPSIQRTVWTWNDDYATWEPDDEAGADYELYPDFEGEEDGETYDDAAGTGEKKKRKRVETKKRPAPVAKRKRVASSESDEDSEEAETTSDVSDSDVSDSNVSDSDSDSGDSDAFDVSTAADTWIDFPIPHLPGGAAPAVSALKQPLRTLHELTAKPKPFRLPPQRRLAELVDERVARLPRAAAPVSVSVTVPVFPNTVNSVQDDARAVGLALEGKEIAGFYPTSPSLQGKLPKTDFGGDFRGRRAQQVPEQFGTVFKQALIDADKKPIETQFTWAAKANGKIDVFASANDPVATRELANLLQNPREVLGTVAKKATAGKKDSNVQRQALKLIGFERQQAERRAQIPVDRAARAPRLDNEADLELAKRIWGRVLEGPVHVVQNDAVPRSKRHTEQLNRIAIEQAAAGYTHGESGGSFIRCEGCSAELGPNLQNAAGVKLIGKIYKAQAALPQHTHIFNEVNAGRIKVVTNQPTRPRSPSPPHEFSDDLALAVALDDSEEDVSAASEKGKEKKGKGKKGKEKKGKRKKGKEKKGKEKKGKRKAK